MNKKFFGKTSKGEDTYTYEISNNNGMRMVLTDFGASVVSIFIKDKNGVERDVVLGYDDVSVYERETAYFGATVGRNANRISGASIEVEGKTYKLDANDYFENNLHSGQHAVSGRIWSVKNHEANKITFTIVSLEELEGFPGDATLEVTFELTDNNEEIISYYGMCDKTTVYNLTNHAYWNLNGHDSGVNHSQELQIFASHYTPVSSSKSIPKGFNEPVEGTPFDFRQAKPIGQDIKAEHEQLGFANGYDHNFALDKEAGEMTTAAIAYAPESGIRMEVITDCPGIQLYTANFIHGHKGKGVEYVDQGAYCLETQFYPNAMNVEAFQSPVVQGGTPYTSKTIYKFTV